ncbi:MAG TPA: DinB family protein [Longimicrobiales bacterium]|nr:DinB family protein [Longimicrobiales bacterium]
MSRDAEGLVRLLDGTGAHASTVESLEDLDEERAAARLEGWPHSCHEILLHMVFWQDLFLARLEERPAPLPSSAAEGWPAPERNRWSDTLGRFTRGLEAAKGRAREDDLDARLGDWRGIARGEGLSILAQHNSYHLGQIVLLRRVLGAWPPPGGGDTW